MHGIIASERSGVECAREHSRTLRNYSYAYLELRRALKLRVLIGHNSAHSGMRDAYRKIGALRRLGSSLARNYKEARPMTKQNSGVQWRAEANS